MFAYRAYVLLTAYLGLCHCQTNCSFEALMTHLNLDDQNPDVRPVLNWENRTEVPIGITLYTIVKLDTSLQSLTSYVWFYMEWKNEFISWNPDNFCGIEQVFTTAGNIWKPDLYIWEMTETDDKNPVILYYNINSNGTIKAAYPIRIVSSCNLNMFMFPFDTQRCNLTFDSYIQPDADVYMTTKIDSAQVYSKSKKQFLSIGEWKLVNITVDRPDKGVTYTITIQRNPVIQIIAFIIPMCFLVLLDIIGVFIHLENRLMFKVSVVLGFSVLLIVLNQILPTSDSAPLLSIFCCAIMANMVVSILGTITASYMLTLSETNSEVPHWIKVLVIKCLARVLCFNLHSSKQDLSNVMVAENGATNKTKTRLNAKGKGTVLSTGVRNATETHLLKMLLFEVQKIHRNIIHSKNQDEDKADWHIVALVVDRLFLILYLIVVIILFGYVFAAWASDY